VTDGRSVEELVVGILGGTGPQGRGLAVRFAAAGQRVLLGSRNADRAAETSAEVASRASTAGGIEASVQGGSNADVAGAADVVVVAVPFDGHAATLAELAAPLAGKVVADCVVPMGWDELGAYVLDVEEGSVAQQAAALLPDSSVVAAFHHLSAVLLEDLSQPTLDGDVMVLGDDRAATDLVQALAGRLPGMRGIYAGRLRNARQVEALTVNLVSVNRRYKAHAGIRVTDV
jgi:8-hydroxy-5-deazaflavin:NADPH oxidoreductase